jgi:hypothetical protein
MEDAVAFDLAAAVSRNRFWASRRRKVQHGPRRLIWQGQGWGPLSAAIGAWVFGEYDPPPTPERFAQLIARWQRGQEGLAVNGVLSRTPWRRMRELAARGIPPEYTSPLHGLPRPHGWEQILAVFGDPRTMAQDQWERHHIGLARAPGARRFTLADGCQVPALRLHRHLVPHAEALFAAVAHGGLWDELHAWGIALDLRPAQYPPAGRAREVPDIGQYPPGYLLRHVQAHGWQWGLWFEVPHPGHLQFATGVEAC